MKNLNMNRIFKASKEKVFEAIANGILFKHTGTTKESHFDFKVGGSLYLVWDDCGPVEGSFLSIENDSHVSFSWNYTPEGSNTALETKVDIDLFERNGLTTLSLVHSGFESVEEREDHNGGWNDCLKDLHTVFFDMTKKSEQERDLSFRMHKRIDASAQRIYEAFISQKEIQKFFVNEQIGDFKVGQSVHWQFEGVDEKYEVHVHQLIPCQLIKFQWGNSHVCISLKEHEKNKTIVFLQVSGFEDTQIDLKNSYDECSGWMEVLFLLKNYLEG